MRIVISHIYHECLEHINYQLKANKRRDTIDRMELKQVQICLDYPEMEEVQVASHSDPDTHYIVLITNEDDDPICECEGFQFRGHCSHQQEALNQFCRWEEISGPEKQTQEQHDNHICPRCSGPTDTILEYV